MSLQVKARKDYRVFMYLCNPDGVMESVIVSAIEAEELHEQGWRMSPAAFLTDRAVTDVAIVDNFNQTLQTLINISVIDDVAVLRDLAVNFFGMTVDERSHINSIRKRLIKRATKEGLIHG